MDEIYYFYRVSFNLFFSYNSFFKPIIAVLIIPDTLSISCPGATLSFDIDASDFSQDELIGLNIEGVLYEVENGNIISPPDPLPLRPSYDWEPDLNNPGFYFSTISSDNLTPDTDYEIHLTLTREDGQTYGTNQIYPFSIGAYGTSNALTCAEDSPPVATVSSTTVDSDCNYEFCFSPVYVNGEKVLEYRIDVRDQDGNQVGIYKEFLPDDPEPFCIAANDGQIATLIAPPFVAQLVAIHNFRATYGNRFDLETCCTGLGPDPELTNIEYQKCYSYYAYVEFCLDETLGLCPYDDIDISVVSDFDRTKVWSLGNNCFRVQFFKNEKISCEDRDYTIYLTINGTNTFETLVSGSYIYSDCNCFIAEEQIPIPVPISNFNFGGSSDDELFFYGKVPQLNEIIKQSRLDGIPVSYIVFEESEDNIIKDERFYGTLSMKLPQIYFDKESLNNRYQVHLLAGDQFYELSFLDLANKGKRTGQYNNTSNLSVFPNPTEGLINLSLDEGVINTVSVYDIHGKEILFKEAASNRLQITLPMRMSRTYFIKVTAEDGKSYQRKVVLATE